MSWIQGVVFALCLSVGLAPEARARGIVDDPVEVTRFTGAAKQRDAAADFTAALANARRLLESGKAKEARAALDTALEAHKDQPYARAALATIRELLAGCAFGLAHPKRTVKDVFCGTVASYDAKSGKIELRWEKPKPGKDEAAAPAFPCGDFVADGGGFLLRVPFEGPCSIELAGKAIGQKTPIVRAGITAERCYEAHLDAGSLSSIYRIEHESKKSLASSSTSYNVMRPYKLELALRDAQIEAKHNGTRLVIADRPKKEFGQLGFRDVLDPTTIVVTGKASVAWIEAEITRRTAEDRTAFDAQYDVAVDLPAWLRAR